MDGSHKLTKQGCTNWIIYYSIIYFLLFIWSNTLWMPHYSPNRIIFYFKHFNIDIRNKKNLEKVFKKYNNKINCIIHAAAQPSHDWAVKEPQTDFSINANGTMNLLDLTKKYCSRSVFIYVSTNKVYGDLPNFLPLTEKKEIWD